MTAKTIQWGGRRGAEGSPTGPAHSTFGPAAGPGRHFCVCPDMSTLVHGPSIATGVVVEHARRGATCSARRWSRGKTRRCLNDYIEMWSACDTLS